MSLLDAIILISLIAFWDCCIRPWVRPTYSESRNRELAKREKEYLESLKAVTKRLKDKA